MVLWFFPSKLSFLSICIQLTAWSDLLIGITAYPSEIEELMFVVQAYVCLFNLKIASAAFSITTER